MSYSQFPLDATPTSVREAREATRRWLRGIGRSLVESPAVIVVSELVTNSIVHARGPVELHLWDHIDHVRIGVSDGSTTIARNEPVPLGAISGRGMRLVERFSSHWGSDVGDSGKLTWADIPAAR